MIGGLGAFASGLAGGLNTGQDIRTRRALLESLGVEQPAPLGAIRPQARPTTEEPAAPEVDASATTIRPQARGVGPAVEAPPARPASRGRSADTPLQASLAGTESGGDWRALNDQGYGGRLQFGDDRLLDAARAGIIPAMTPEEFAQAPEDVQRRVEDWHLADINSQIERRGLSRYIGTTIQGVTMTPEAIAAMAHLGGLGGASQFLRTGGEHNPADAYGTTLLDYARRHGGAGGGARGAIRPPSGNQSQRRPPDDMTNVRAAVALALMDDAPAASMASSRSRGSSGIGAFAEGLAGGLRAGQRRRQRDAIISLLGEDGATSSSSPYPSSSSSNSRGTPPPLIPEGWDWSRYLAGAAASRDDSVSGLAPEFQGGLASLFQASEEALGQGLQIGSGYRSVERQQQLWDEAVARYGSEQAARRWVAPPGRSQHNHGRAVDLWWNGQRLDRAPEHVRQWVHDNAAHFGLSFPMSWEPWHIEPIGARGAQHTH